MEIQYTVKVGQSLFDISLEKWGDYSGVFPIAKANGISSTESLKPGMRLTVPLPDVKPMIVQWFETENIVIATSDSPKPEPPEGIGNVFIENPEPVLTLG